MDLQKEGAEHGEVPEGGDNAQAVPDPPLHIESSAFSAEQGPQTNAIVALRLTVSECESEVFVATGLWVLQREMIKICGIGLCANESNEKGTNQ